MAIDSGSQLLLGPALMPVLEEGAKIVQESVRRIVSNTAQNPSGALEKAITFETQPSQKRAVMGWEKSPIKDAKGRRKRSSYVDSSGRRRKVTTVADYGRILEYSQRRQLRHMEVGFELAEEKALERMEEMSDKLMQKAADEAFRRAGL